MHELFYQPFFINAMVGMLLLSVASALIGTYVVTRRLVAISGGVTHACFGGLGLGYFLGINPIIMAAVFAVGSSLGVEWLSARRAVREDSAIAVVWSIGMAVGVLFVFLTPGYVPELTAFLFGSILNISTTDLLVFGVFTALLILFFVWKFKTIVACAFDRDFARILHLPVTLINMVMTVMIALCIVLTIRMVGIMLLMSMLSLPQMTAEIYTHRFKSMLWLSVGISVICCLGGLLLGTVIDVPCSALIVITQTCVYFIGRISKMFLRLI